MKKLRLNEKGIRLPEAARNLNPVFLKRRLKYRKTKAIKIKAILRASNDAKAHPRTTTSQSYDARFAHLSLWLFWKVGSVPDPAIQPKGRVLFRETFLTFTQKHGLQMERRYREMDTFRLKSDL